MKSNTRLQTAAITALIALAMVNSSRAQQPIVLGNSTAYTTLNNPPGTIFETVGQPGQGAHCASGQCRFKPSIPTEIVGSTIPAPSTTYSQSIGSPNTCVNGNCQLIATPIYTQTVRILETTKAVVPNFGKVKMTYKPGQLEVTGTKAFGGSNKAFTESLRPLEAALRHATRSEGIYYGNAAKVKRGQASFKLTADYNGQACACTMWLDSKKQAQIRIPRNASDGAQQLAIDFAMRLWTPGSVNVTRN